MSKRRKLFLAAVALSAGICAAGGVAVFADKEGEPGQTGEGAEESRRLEVDKTAREIKEFWTRERMDSAEPMPLPRR